MGLKNIRALEGTGVPFRTSLPLLNFFSRGIQS